MFNCPQYKLMPSLTTTCFYNQRFVILADNFNSFYLV